MLRLTLEKWRKDPESATGFVRECVDPQDPKRRVHFRARVTDAWGRGANLSVEDYASDPSFYDDGAGSGLGRSAGVSWHETAARARKAGDLKLKSLCKR